MKAWETHPRGSLWFCLNRFFISATPLLKNARSLYAAELITFLRTRRVGGVCARPIPGDSRPTATPVPAVIRNSRRVLFDMPLPPHFRLLDISASLKDCHERALARGAPRETAADAQGRSARLTVPAGSVVRVTPSGPTALTLAP